MDIERIAAWPNHVLGHAVLWLLAIAEPVVQIARRAKISEQTQYRWRELFLSGGKQVLGGRGALFAQDKTIEQLKAPRTKRDQEISEITVANRL